MLYLIEMFNQFNTILGVRKDDYMSGSKAGVQNAVANVVEQAKPRDCDSRSDHEKSRRKQTHRISESGPILLAIDFRVALVFDARFFSSP